MKLSVVTTLYCSGPHLREFYERMTASVLSVTDDYEIIMVNDGSPDDSLAIARELVARDCHVVVVDLSRNFGHHKAIMAGLSYAQGKLVFLIDCDLEEDPENFPQFYNKLKASDDCDVVYGVQPQRKGSLLNVFFARIFYRVLNGISSISFDDNMVFSRLMTLRYVKSLLRFGESELFLVGLWSITGYTQQSICILTRHRGESSYTFAKKMAMVVNAITSFSNKPLSLIFYTGLIIEVIAIIYTTYALLSYLILKQTMSGWVSIVISIWMLGGAIILFLGIIGQYLSKIFIETKNRPYVIIRQEYRNQSVSSEGGEKILKP